MLKNNNKYALRVLLSAGMTAKEAFQHLRAAMTDRNL